MPRRVTRRQAIKASAALASTYGLNVRPRLAGAASPNEKLNIAFIGVGGRGAANVKGCAGQNFLAFADVDDVRAAQTYEKYPQVTRFRDYRKMFDAVGSPAAVIRERDDKETVLIRGMAERVEVRRRMSTQIQVRLTLTPRVARLRHTRDYRVFQDTSVRTIISRLLGDLHHKYTINQADMSGSSGDFDKDMKAVDELIKESDELATRPYCVQFGESDWDFINRLLEDLA